MPPADLFVRAVFSAAVRQAAFLGGWPQHDCPCSACWAAMGLDHLASFPLPGPPGLERVSSDRCMHVAGVRVSRALNANSRHTVLGTAQCQAASHSMSSHSQLETTRGASTGRPNQILEGALCGAILGELHRVSAHKPPCLLYLPIVRSIFVPLLPLEALGSSCELQLPPTDSIHVYVCGWPSVEMCSAGCELWQHSFCNGCVWLGTPSMNGRLSLDAGRGAHP